MADDYVEIPSGQKIRSQTKLVSGETVHIHYFIPATGDATEISGANPLPVSGPVTANPPTSSTATHTSVNRSVTSVTLLAANANRKGATIYNDTDTDLYVKYGTAASLTSFKRRIPSYRAGVVAFPLYTGIITGIWASAGSGAARVCEET